MGRRPGLLIIYWAMILWGAWVVPAAAETRRIVLLSDETRVLPGLSTLDDSLLSTLAANSSDTLEVYHETMDLSAICLRVLTKSACETFWPRSIQTRRSMRRLPSWGPRLTSCSPMETEFFRALPSSFVGSDRREIGDRSLPPHVSGVLLTRKFGPTVELALRLHPGTQRVMVVAGTSEFDNRILRDAKEEFRHYEDRVAFTYLTELPLAQLLTEIAKVPPRTIVLFTTYFRDGVGQRFCPPRCYRTSFCGCERACLSASSINIFGCGIVGGSLYGLGPQGPEAAKLALEILKGTRPSRASLLEPELRSTTVSIGDNCSDMGISEKACPPEARFSFVR